MPSSEKGKIPNQGLHQKSNFCITTLSKKKVLTMPATNKFVLGLEHIEVNVQNVIFL
jgi:hypothetical protein